MLNQLILFGATGDLARRMLLPSLFGLHTDELLPPNFRIIAAARRDIEDGQFKETVADALGTTVSKDRLAHAKVKSFVDRFLYISVDSSKISDFKRLERAAGAPNVGSGIFLSTAPSLFQSTIEGLMLAGLAGPESRIGLEKPLGSDLRSSRKINDAVALAFPEERTFRVDHYLGKETVQNLLALRFANSIFEPLWNSSYIEHIQISVAETIGLEGRTEFYDETGALRDMVQSHMLQLLAFVAMEPPARIEASAVRDEKVKVLRSLRRIGRRGGITDCVRAQYERGAVSGEIVASYREELGRVSDTETFVALKAHVDNWRWKGVPFYLRTGKRLVTRKSEIMIQFRDVPHSIFGEREVLFHSNKLIIRLQPEENIRLLIMAKEPGLDRGGVRLRELPLDISLSNAFADGRRRIAYERLLLDLIEGDPTLFVRRDEVEAQWQWIDAIRNGWKSDGSAMRFYPAGTWGPSAAMALAERNGVSWYE